MIQDELINPIAICAADLIKQIRKGQLEDQLGDRSSLTKDGSAKRPVQVQRGCLETLIGGPAGCFSTVLQASTALPRKVGKTLIKSLRLNVSLLAVILFLLLSGL
jgi:hypothetical protein